MNRSLRPFQSYVATESGSLRPVFETLEDRTQPSGFAGLGAAAQFGVLALQNTDINSNQVTVAGNVGVSQGGGFQNQAHSSVTGNVVEFAAGDYTGQGTVGGGLLVNPALLASADANALSASAQAAALAPTQSFGSITKATTVVGNGGLNVININGDIKASLTLSGGPNDVFIINVTGSLKFNQNSVLGLAGGATANHVLYNFTGASGDINTGDNNVLNGTLLAPRYNVNLDGVLNGELIAGGKTINLLPGLRVNAIPFATATPQAADAALTGMVFLDLNTNGVRDPGEPGIAGVELSLTGVDVNGVTVRRTASTDDNGVYTFTDLVPGTYTLFENQPADYADGDETVGNVNGEPRGQRLENDRISQITLGHFETGVDYNFAEVFVPS